MYHYLTLTHFEVHVSKVSQAPYTTQSDDTVVHLHFTSTTSLLTKTLPRKYAYIGCNKSRLYQHKPHLKYDNVANQL